MERLIKNLEALKFSQSTTEREDGTKKPLPETTKQGKLAQCSVVVESLMGLQSSSEFPRTLSVAMEVLLMLCDDGDSDVRMAAGEALNKLIRSLMGAHLGKLQVELYKEIKKNGSTRSLRAALSRFAELCHLIRPQKRRPYAMNLFQCLVRIVRRQEESIQESVAAALHKISPALGGFTNDNEIKILLKAFLSNVGSSSVVVRRATAQSLTSIVLNCRKPCHFSSWLFKHLIDGVSAAGEDGSITLLLGVLPCLRQLVPHLEGIQPKDDLIQGSFGLKHSVQADNQTSDYLLQVYELALMASQYSDIRVVTAGLELLLALLKSLTSNTLNFLRESGELGVGGYPLLKSRTGSEMSMAPSVGDEDSQLLDSMSELDAAGHDRAERFLELQASSEQALASRAEPSSPLHDNSPSEAGSVKAVYMNMEIGSIADDDDNVTYPRNITSTVADEGDSQEPSYYSLPPSPGPKRQMDAGWLVPGDGVTVTARLLSGLFLLGGGRGYTQPDSVVRVSIKSLALSCLANLARAEPAILFLQIYRENLAQPIHDVLLFREHSDPQLRGGSMYLVGCYLEAWLQGLAGSQCEVDEEELAPDILIHYLMEGLRDESPITSKQAVTGVCLCLNPLITSPYAWLAVPLLETSLMLVSSSYWLLKVELADLAGSMPLTSLRDGSRGRIQGRVLNDVILVLLADEDGRVRSAAATALSKMVNNLYLENGEWGVSCEWVEAGRQLNSMLISPLKGENPLGPHALSSLLHTLWQSLSAASSRYFAMGCIQALCVLSEAFPIDKYMSSWHCVPQDDLYANARVLALEQACGYLELVMSLLTSHAITTDIPTHVSLLILARNLIKGLYLAARSIPQLKPSKDVQPEVPWCSIKHDKLMNLTEKLLVHSCRVLCAICLVIEEAPPQPVSTPSLKIASPGTSTLSPNRGKQGSGSDERASEEKKTSKVAVLGAIHNLPEYHKLYDVLQGVYTNYKISVEAGSGDKLCSMMEASLEALGSVLDVGVNQNISQHTEELLHYVRHSITLAPSSALLAVRQLLKALFETNQASQDGEEDGDMNDVWGGGGAVPPLLSFYDICCLNPDAALGHLLFSDDPYVEEFEEEIKKARCAFTVRSVKKADMSSLSSYIRLFEPVVIKAMKLYTLTGEVTVQVQVLHLLVQLVQLRVNYSLLDSDQIFTQFVLRQFQFLEEGHIPNPELLLKGMFEFLLLLSYEQVHSKGQAPLNVPQVLQLCDRLMASGQSPESHCLPSLGPLTQDLFLVRGGTMKGEAKQELDTQREVLLSMLLRLAQYPQILDLLGVVVRWAKTDNKAERWRRVSRQVMDALLPLLSNRQLQLHSVNTLTSLLKLFAAMSPCVFRPLDPLLKLMFTKLINQGMEGVSGWATISIVGLHVIQTGSPREEVLLARVGVVGVSSPTITSVQDITTPQPEQNADVFAKWVLDIVSGVIHSCHAAVYSGSVCVNVSLREFLLEQLLTLCLYLRHMFQSGAFTQITQSCKDLFEQSREVETLNKLVLQLGQQYPVVSLHWCWLLTQLKFKKIMFWDDVLGPPSHSWEETEAKMTSSSVKILQDGGLILFCDYVREDMSEIEPLSWLLVNHVRSLLWQSAEPPVSSLISSMQANPAAFTLLFQAISTRVPHVALQQGCLAMHVVNCLLGGVRECAVELGSILTLVVQRILPTHHLYVAREGSKLAQVCAESLLRDPVQTRKQLTQEDLVAHLAFLKKTNRHKSLIRVLEDMQSTVWNVSPMEMETVKVETSIPGHIGPMDYAAYVSLVKRWGRRGADVSPERVAQLMAQLEYSDILSILLAKDTNLKLLTPVLQLGFQSLKSTMGVGYSDWDAISGGSSGSASPMDEGMSPIYRAAKVAILQHVSHLISLLPLHQKLFEPSEWVATPGEVKYSARLMELLREGASGRGAPGFWGTLTAVGDASRSLVLHWQQQGGDVDMPINAVQDLARLALLCLEAAKFLTLSGQVESVDLLHQCLNTSEALLRVGVVWAVLTLPDHESWCASAAHCLHHVLSVIEQSPLPPPGISLAPPPDGPESLVGTVTACLKTASLVRWLEENRSKTHNSTVGRLVVALARLPLLNAFARIPPEVFAMGWELPGYQGVLSPPPLPPRFLQEGDVLRQLIFRVLVLGWTSRQQFEETWMILLGVLSGGEGEGEEERGVLLKADCLATQAIGGLLLHTLLLPYPGNPHASSLIHQPRLNPINQLRPQLNGLVKAAEAIVKTTGTGLVSALSLKGLENLDRCGQSSRLGLGQLSISCLRAVMEENQTLTVTKAHGGWLAERENRLAASGLDLHSCLHFLLDLFTQWSRPQGGCGTALLLAAVRTSVLVSELFCTRAHWQWLLDTLLQLYRQHISEDALLLPHLIVGVCKAAAVIGQASESLVETLKKLLEDGLHSLYICTQLAAMHATLYLLEGGLLLQSDCLPGGPTLITYLTTHLQQGIGWQSPEQMAMVWSLSFYLLENCWDQLIDSDFSQRSTQLATHLLGNNHTPPRVFLFIYQGLVRLCTRESGSSINVGLQGAIRKSISNLLQQRNPYSALAAITLQLADLHAGKEKAEPPEADVLVLAMERLTTMLHRIRCGGRVEAAAFTEVAGQLAVDFLPPADILYKLMGELLSHNHPHPQHMAKIAFKVLSSLPGGEVEEWVGLSLPSLLDRAPEELAVWTVSCLLLASSYRHDPWLHHLHPYIATPRSDAWLLHQAATSFYKQLDSGEQRSALLAALELAAGRVEDSPFGALAEELRSIEMTMDPLAS